MVTAPKEAILRSEAPKDSKREGAGGRARSVSEKETSTEGLLS
jgi:hypothetical protein